MTHRGRRVATFLAGGAALLLLARSAAAQDRVLNPHGKLQWECSTCHRADAWKPVRITSGFDHGKTGFPLVGAHAATPCRSCHVSLEFHGVERNCLACHKDVHQGELGVNCSQCHTSRSFLDRSAMTRAHRETRFPLTGAHLSTDCESCHTPSGQGHMTFVGQPTDCVQCHMASYQTAQNPNHVAGGFPTDCNQCHSTAAWPLARFSHANTGFPLTGAHLATPCSSCHGDGVFKGKPTACYACHQKDYAGATDPNHAAAGFPTDCTQCHNTTAWTGATFDHSTTKFPLTGAHATVTCQQCHGDGVYAGKSTACVSCHQTDYNATTNPGHAAAQFPTDCTQCHTTATWSGATFNHDGPFFPIYSGVHKNRWTTCTQCHTNPSNYAQFACTTCHGQSETNSNHSGVSGYSYNSQACYSCHPRP